MTRRELLSNVLVPRENANCMLIVHIYVYSEVMATKENNR